MNIHNAMNKSALIYTIFVTIIALSRRNYFQEINMYNHNLADMLPIADVCYMNVDNYKESLLLWVSRLALTDLYLN